MTGTIGNAVDLSKSMERDQEPKSESPKVCDEEYVRTTVDQAVCTIIGDASYTHDATSAWTNEIVETLVRQFVSVDRENKYIVSCMIVQKSSAGMRSATSCFWNAQTDSGHSITTERSDMYVITTVFICKA